VCVCVCVCVCVRARVCVRVLVRVCEIQYTWFVMKILKFKFLNKILEFEL